MSAPLVVSIGMTHPHNVAGLGLDIRIAAEYGVRHAMVVAAVSAQDDRGVQAISALPGESLLLQLRAAGAGDAAAVRIGALGTAAHAAAIAGFLTAPQNVVLDPVLGSSAGGSLYVDDPLAALLALAAQTRAVVTPNLEEAERLTGIHVERVEDMLAAGQSLCARGARAALVKGGHLRGDPVDVLVSGDVVETFADSRLPQRMRGTGCRLAMALACELALGRTLGQAVRGARAYVRANLARL